MHKEQRNNPTSDETGLLGRILGNADRLVDVDKRLKVPTIPVYDSENFPDEATRGQIVRDIQDPTVMWVYGEDDEWHQIGAPGTDLFVRYFTIEMNHAKPFVPGPYGGAREKIVDWTQFLGPASSANWLTNDTTDGSTITDLTTEPFDTGNFFTYDPNFPTVGAYSFRPGAYLAEAVVDLRVYGGIASPYDFYMVLGIDSPATLGAQSPQASKHEKNTNYDTSLKIDLVQMGWVLDSPANPEWSVGFGHNYSSNVAFTVKLSIIWIGEFTKDFTP